jgi:hypothetical protein
LRAENKRLRLERDVLALNWGESEAGEVVAVQWDELLRKVPELAEPDDKWEWMWGKATCGEGAAPMCSKCQTAITPVEMFNHEASCWDKEE